MQVYNICLTYQKKDNNKMFYVLPYCYDVKQLISYRTIDGILCVIKKSLFLITCVLCI